jgi:thiosulfate dehydrogenase
LEVHFGSRKLELALAAAFALSLACSEAESIDNAEHGRDLFTSKQLSPSRLNNYTCANCHLAAPAETSLIRTGSPLAGVTRRPWFWGGQENDLLRAINACRSYFMAAPEPLVPTDADAEALYAFLLSLEPGDPEPVPFEVVRAIEPLPRGNAEAGLSLFVDACSYCHGVIHSGAGRLSERVPILPEDTVAEHAGYSLRAQRLVFIEKIRHGLFLGYGGDMPPFSREQLSDPQVSDLLEALGILGE